MNIVLVCICSIVTKSGQLLKINGYYRGRIFMPYYKNDIIKFVKDIQNKIESRIYTKISELDIEAWITPEPVEFKNRTAGRRIQLRQGDKWGKLWDCAWFHFTGKVPQYKTDKSIVLLIDISGEACIVDNEGCPIQGLTNVASDFDLLLGKPGKRVFRLDKEFVNGDSIDIWADAGLNDLFGMYKENGTILEASIALFDEEMKNLYYDFEVLTDFLNQIPSDSARYNSILFALNDASNTIKYFSSDEIKEASDILSVELKKRGGDPSLSISAIGHAHIDLAWLWPIRETKRKGARTFSTALRMMDIYPDYVFGASQPQLFQWVKEDYPVLYEKIKTRVQEDRWECQGAMWVEADTNISGGEALVRQIIYGKRFFKEEFDKDMKICWLPDVFGYSGALPQLLKKSGIDYFMTTKLSWNKYNKHPHHTFFWKGIDGSEVLSHMPPEGNYNSSAAPRALLKAEKQYSDNGVSDNCLLLFGIGDGGGGPWEDHLERLKREKDLNGLPPVVQEPSINFFHKLEKNRKKYKTWTGELYFEMHQGTYTTQARNKKFNRKMELKLRDLEFLLTMAMIHLGLQYPKDEIDEIWKEVLLYQFHDILPGSSIKRVYDESVEGYERLLSRVNDLIDNAKSSIAFQIHTEGVSNPAILINTLSWPRQEWVELKDKWHKVNIPAMGYMVLNADQESEICLGLNAENNILENDLIRVEFSVDGAIKSVFDKENCRQVLENGTFGNRLAVYEDEGDAWDFSINYDQRKIEYFKLEKMEKRIDGPKVIIKQEYTYCDSLLTQEIVLTLGSRRIDFVTHINWNESAKMLRTSFPVNIFATEATCEIQFGNTKRPNHNNSSIDMAKYEICAHKWVDMSQYDYGVALLNDCKYGYKVNNNILDLNLLRSTSVPGEEADKGQHDFTYSLYPHSGDYIAGGIVRQGYELNVPVEVMHSKKHIGELHSVYSFVELDAENVVVETVKRAEYDNSIIIRLYECNGSGAKANIKLDYNVKDVKIVDLMENEVSNLELNGNIVQLQFSPFEIQTIKLLLRDNFIKKI